MWLRTISGASSIWRRLSTRALIASEWGPGVAAAGLRISVLQTGRSPCASPKQPGAAQQSSGHTCRAPLLAVSLCIAREPALD